MVQVFAPGVEVTVYPVIALPPLDAGAVQLTNDAVLPTAPLTPVGAPGTVRGITLPDAAESGESPEAFFARTLNVYVVPFVKPVNVQERFRVFTHAAGAVTAGDEITVYPVIALPPLDPGALQLTTEDALATVPLTPVGAPGGAAGMTLDEATDGREFPCEFVAITVNV